jgi:hypothetical protein
VTTTQEPPLQVEDGYQPRVESTFRARYEHPCSECGSEIYVGHRISRLSTGVYVHGECAEFACGSG